MLGPALASSHLVRALLHLGEGSWSGEIRLGGRLLHVVEGRLARVAPSESDPSLRPFLQAAGLGTDADGSGPEEAQLARLASMAPARTLAEFLRAAWVERLAAAMESALRRGESPIAAPAGEDEQPARPPWWEASPPLFETTLEALARLALRGPAEQLGRLAAAHALRWQAGGPVGRARRWAGLPPGAEETLVAWLERDPGGAPRLAALVLGGLATLQPLEPGLQPEGTSARPRFRPEPLDRWRPRPPSSEAAEDPLREHERALARSEQEGAPAAVLAQRWLELARAWRRLHDAPVEEARCARQAAALVPEDPQVQRTAAEACLRAARPDLALRYAQLALAAAEARQDPDEERRLQAWFARFAPRLGAEEPGRRARERAAQLGERAARLDRVGELARAGETRRALQLAMATAAEPQGAPLEHATALLAWACTLAPEDAEVRQGAAELLAHQGRVEAGVALLLEGASLAEEVHEARALRIRAAELAEEAARPDLASRALLEAFEREPQLEVLHEALAADLEAGADPARLAVLLEEIAAHGGERRGDWLRRAAEAHLAAGHAFDAGELAARALLETPDEPQILEVLQAACEALRDAAMEADLLERVVRHWHPRAPRRTGAVLRRLAVVATEQLHSPPRAMWAWSRLEALEGSEEARRQAALWRERAGARRQAVALAERDVDAAASPTEALAARRTLAALLRDWPDDRRRAAALYEEVLAHEPDDEVAWASLERLHRALGDEEERTRALWQWLRRLPPGARRGLVAARLAALEAWRGRWGESARAAELGAGHGAPSPLLLRLERAARHIGEDVLLRHALALQVELDPGAQHRVALRARLAETLDAMDRGEEALEEALEALRAAPDAATAAAVLLRHLRQAPPERLAEAVELARRALGDSPPLLRACAEAAAEAGRPLLAAELILAAARLPPPDLALAARALRQAVEARKPQWILEASSLLVDLAHLDPAGAAATFEEMVEALARIGAPQLAVRVALDALDGLAHAPPGLAERCLDLAETCEEPSLRRAALERCIARARGRRRASLLKALAAARREEGDRAGEVRAWLRVLHELPEDPAALRRLAELLDQGGDHERLAEVVALQALRSDDPAERRALTARRAAVLALGLGRLEEGCAVLRGLLQEAPAEGLVELLPRVAATLASWGETQRAVQWLCEEAERLAPARRAEAVELFLEAVQLAEEAGGGAHRFALEAASRALRSLPTEAPLLDAFERLALRLEDEQAVAAFYERRIGEALGRHARRALRYRWGRWLHRAGRAERAATTLLEALAEDPAEGVVLAALLEAADAAGCWEQAVSGLSLVARSSRDAACARRMAARAATLLADRLARPRAALELLLEVGERAGLDGALREHARLLLQRLPADDPESDALRQRAEPLVEEHRETLVLGEVGPAVADEPGEAGVEERDLATPEPAPHEEAGLDAAGLEPDPEEPPRLEPAPQEERQQEGEDASNREGHEEDPSRDDSPSATWRRWSNPEPEQAAPRDETERLLREAREAPLRPEVLGALLEEAERRGASGLARACRMVLAAARGDAGASQPVPHLLRAAGDPIPLLHHGEPEALWEALRLLWEHAGSSLLRPLSHWGILGTERMPIFARRALARAHVELVGALRPGDVVVYLHPLGSHPVRVLPTRPVALAVDPSVEELPEPALRAAMGAALAWSRAEHLLLATAPPVEAVPRARAVLGAFGSGGGAPASREDAAFVARLWEVVPGAVQRRLRELLSRPEVPDEPEAVVAAVRRAGLRAGLLAAGGLLEAWSGLEGFDLSETERADLAAFLFAEPTLATLAAALQEGPGPTAATNAAGALEEPPAG